MYICIYVSGRGARNTLAPSPWGGVEGPPPSCGCGGGLAMHCNAMAIVHCNPMQYNAMQSINAPQSNSMRCNAVQSNKLILF